MGLWVLWMVAQMPPPSISVDGVIAPGEDWILLGVSTSPGDPALNLDTLWGYLTAETLYVAFKARGNFPNDTLVFVLPLDLDRVNGSSCAYSNCAADPGGFLVRYGNERSRVLGDWDTLYFAADYALVLRSLPGPSPTCVAEVFSHSGSGWTSTGAPGVWVCGYSGGNTALTVEWKIALQDQGMPVVNAFHLNLYGVVKDQPGPLQNSAVDCIPWDSQCGNSANERTDADTLSAVVRLSRFRRTGEGLRITEVYYDPPGGSDSYEFVEVLNTGSDTADLSFFILADDPVFAFPEGGFQLPKDLYLAPGEFLVLTLNADSLNQYLLNSRPSIYPDLIVLAYEGRTFVGQLMLGNGGDDVHLYGGQVSPYDTTRLVLVDRMWYGNGGDMGNTGAAPSVPAGSSLERKTYGLWSGTPAQDFVRATPSPGDLPPQFLQIGIPTYTSASGGVWVVSVVLGDTLPFGDTIQSAFLYYRLSTNGGSTWTAWTIAFPDSVGPYPKTSGVVQRYYYSFPDSVGGLPATHVEYYFRASDAWGRAFGDNNTTTGGVVTAVGESPVGTRILVHVNGKRLHLAGLAPGSRVELLDALGRRRGVFWAPSDGKLQILLDQDGVLFLRLPGEPVRRVVVLP